MSLSITKSCQRIRMNSQPILTGLIKCVIFNEANILSYKDFFSVISHFHINGCKYFTSFPTDCEKHTT